MGIFCTVLQVSSLFFISGRILSLKDNSVKWLVHQPPNALNNGTLVKMHNASFVEKCEFIRTLNRKAKRFLSIDFESLYAIENYFWSVGNGVTLELGALDGSNANAEAPSQTADFVDFGWSRVIIDANPHFRNRMKRFSRDAFSVNAAICRPNMERDVHFVYQSGPKSPSAGIVEFISPSFIAEFYPYLASNLTRGLENLPQGVEATKVSCLPLQKILDHALVQHINFFVLDVEGAEFEILQSISWTHVRFDVLCIETSPEKKSHRQEGFAQIVTRYLKIRGYEHIFDDRRNSWFKHTSFIPFKRPYCCPIPNTVHHPYVQ